MGRINLYQLGTIVPWSQATKNTRRSSRQYDKPELPPADYLLDEPKAPVAPASRPSQSPQPVAPAKRTNNATPMHFCETCKKYSVSPALGRCVNRHA